MMLTRRALFATPAYVAIRRVTVERDQATAPHDVVVVARRIDDIESFDPAESYRTSGGEICGNCYRRLVAPDPAGSANVIGDLAESWNVDAGKSTITLRLRRDVYFGSGQPVTAADAAFSLQRAVILDKRPSFVIRQFGFARHNVEELIQAVDDYTLTLKVPDFDAAPSQWCSEPRFILNFLSASIGSVVEKSAVLANQRNSDLGNEWLKAHTAGAGPFKLASWSANDHVIMDANPYYDHSCATKRVIIRHVADPRMQLRLLQRGDVDIARDFDMEQLTKVHDHPGYHSVQAPRACSMMIRMDGPWGGFEDPQAEFKLSLVGQAIRWAIDYDTIGRITAGAWRVNQSTKVEGLFHKVHEQPFHKDTVRARNLMATAGQLNGFTVTMVHSSHAPFADIARVLQENLAEIDIIVRLLPTESAELVAKLPVRDSRLLLLTRDYDHFNLADNMWGYQFVEVPSQMRGDPLAIMLQRNAVAVLRRNINGLSIGPGVDYPMYDQITKA